MTKPHHIMLTDEIDGSAALIERRIQKALAIMPPPNLEVINRQRAEALVESKIRLCHDALDMVRARIDDMEFDELTALSTALIHHIGL